MTRELFDEIPVALMRESVDGRIVRVNPAARALLAITSETPEAELRVEHLGIPVAERVLRRRVLDHQPVIAYEASLRTFDGRVVDVEATSRALRDAEGRVVGHETAMRDTSALTRATRELRERQAHFRALAEAIQDVCFAIDDDMRLTYWNATAEEITGVSAELALGRTLEEALPGIAPHALIALREAVQTRRMVTYVYDAAALGRGRFFETFVYPMPHGAVSVAIETTAQHELEAALAASEATLRRILEEQDDPIARGRADGTLTFVNQAFCELMARSRDELVGACAADLAPIAGVFALAEALSPRNPTLRTVVARQLDGRSFEWTLRGVFDDDDALTELQCAGRDISTLHDMIAERDVLLREVHHRVKNNLQIVSSLLNLQLQATSDPKLLSVLAESQRRIQAMALIHEHVYRSTEVGQIDAGAYLRHVVEALVQSRPAGNPATTVEIGSATLDLDGAMRLGLIMSELVSNALLHAHPKGGGQVTILVREESDGDITALVADDGVGLPSSVRIEDAATLGLQLVRELSARLRATLEVTRDRGTRVRIRVPSGARRGAPRARA